MAHFAPPLNPPLVVHGVWPCGRRWKGRAWQLWCGAAMEGAPMEGDAG
jgi:hypothetical protein